MLNLKTRFPRYRVTREEGAENGDLYGYLIPCRHGHVYVHGPDMLGVATATYGPIARRLAALPGVTVRQSGDDGINATFPPAAFPAVAQIMRPRTKRKLSPEHRAKLLAAGNSARFTVLNHPKRGQERDGRPTPYETTRADA